MNLEQTGGYLGTGSPEGVEKVYSQLIREVPISRAYSTPPDRSQFEMAHIELRVQDVRYPSGVDSSCIKTPDLGNGIDLLRRLL